MGWTYRHRKLRDRTHADYFAETGKEEIEEEAFMDWLNSKPDHPAFKFLYLE